MSTLKDGAITLTLFFQFNENDLIESVRAEARGRTVAGEVIPTPWEGRWNHYELHDGILIPIEGEVMDTSRGGGARLAWSHHKI